MTRSPCPWPVAIALLMWTCLLHSLMISTYRYLSDKPAFLSLFIPGSGSYRTYRRVHITLRLPHCSSFPSQQMTVHRGGFSRFEAPSPAVVSVSLRMGCSDSAPRLGLNLSLFSASLPRPRVFYMLDASGVALRARGATCMSRCRIWRLGREERGGFICGSARDVDEADHLRTPSCYHGMLPNTTRRSKRKNGHSLGQPHQMAQEDCQITGQCC